MLQNLNPNKIKKTLTFFQVTMTNFKQKVVGIDKPTNQHLGRQWKGERVPIEVVWVTYPDRDNKQIKKEGIAVEGKILGPYAQDLSQLPIGTQAIAQIFPELGKAVLARGKRKPDGSHNLLRIEVLEPYDYAEVDFTGETATLTVDFIPDPKPRRNTQPKDKLMIAVVRLNGKILGHLTQESITLLRSLGKSIKGTAINVTLERVNLPKALVILIDPKTIVNKTKKTLAGEDVLVCCQSMTVETNNGMKLIKSIPINFEVSCVAISPEGHKLAFACKSSIEGNIETIVVSEIDSIINNGLSCKNLAKVNHIVSSLAFSPDGEMLVSCYLNGISIWNLTTKREKFISLSIHDFAITPDSKKLVTAVDEEVLVWDIKTGELLQKFTGNWDYTFSVAISPDNDTIASSCKRLVLLSSMKTGEQEVLQGPMHSIRFVAFSHDGSLVVNELGELWDIKQGEKNNRYPLKWNYEEGVSRYSGSVVVFSPDGSLVAFISKSIIYFLDLNTRKLVAEKRWPSEEKSGPFAFSLDQKTLVTGASKTIKLWDFWN
ncbi:hypothetical protein QUB68_05570 [Microcoleus sp. A006_D1]|uniref:WD40 repeat domain-containing protein n=1 Tax=Microcoleus sp. A006_D1 TaxID=3055267 RepID=UPI002FCEDADD